MIDNVVNKEKSCYIWHQSVKNSFWHFSEHFGKKHYKLITQFKYFKYFKDFKICKRVGHKYSFQVLKCYQGPVWLSLTSNQNFQKWLEIAICNHIYSKKPNKFHCPRVNLWKMNFRQNSSFWKMKATKLKFTISEERGLICT